MLKSLDKNLSNDIVCVVYEHQNNKMLTIFYPQFNIPS